jgi:1-deoxy-D-xylulose 5-phosphate reductoisomerase
LPIIINSANEQAIQMFKSKQIRFDQIINIIEQSINKNKLQQVKTISDVYKIDRIVREQIVKG